MDFETFEKIVKEEKAKKPLLFELQHDNIPTMKDIIAFQEEYQITLPEKYIQVLLNFGGGYFGYANIYSLDKNSYFFISNHNPARVANLFFMADNECGDYYAFRMEDNKCSEEIVFYDHESNTIQNTTFSDVLEYLVEIGLHR